MKLPIFAYGNNVLKVKAQAVASDFPNLHKLIANMWETMEKANGCGLAAPQVGKSLRLFVADSQLLYEAMDERDKIAYFEKGDTGIRRVFINPQIKKSFRRTMGRSRRLFEFALFIRKSSPFVVGRIELSKRTI